MHANRWFLPSTPSQNIIILGAQWGDEGKGKITDAIAEEADLVYRFNGGANAGHTIWVNRQKRVTHLLPSGIIRPGMLNAIGPGVVCSLDALRDELQIVEEVGSVLVLDRSAPVIHGVHRWFDGAREQGNGKIGTTRRGIGPAYEDVGARRIVSLGDLVKVDRVRDALTASNYYAERHAASRAYPEYLEAHPFPTLDELVEDIMSYAGLVTSRLDDTRKLAHEAHAAGKRVLYEGAQGVLLDLYHGSKPYTTSSGCTAAAVGSTMGIHEFQRVIGVTKAYATRVGEGPFPTELDNEIGAKMRTLGDERGATTGRNRRCGWLDLVALRYAVRVGGIRELIVTKLDILAAFNQIKIGTGYTFEGEPIHLDALTTRVMRDAVVTYETVPGWDAQALQGCNSLEDLPDGARAYIARIEEFVGVPVTAVGVGPDRKDLVIAS